MERLVKIAAVCIALSAVILLSNRMGTVEGQQKTTPGQGFAAVPGLKGGNDAFGPDLIRVANWPRPMGESLPDHQAWTWSQSTDIFPEKPEPRLRDAERRVAGPSAPRGAGPPGFRRLVQHQVPRRRRSADTRNRQRHTEPRQGCS